MILSDGQIILIQVSDKRNMENTQKRLAKT